MFKKSLTNKIKQKSIYKFIKTHKTLFHILPIQLITIIYISIFILFVYL